VHPAADPAGDENIDDADVDIPVARSARPGWLQICAGEAEELVVASRQ
jgi:hypothetical protein